MIYAAKKYSHVNGPGCPPKDRPIVKRKYLSEIKEREFDAFFSDKNNVTMSSYHVDPKTNLPLLYLRDNKKTLWEKFHSIYPDGIKRTSFMAHLASGCYIYRQDLGGLCSICNEYCYEVFDNIVDQVHIDVEKESQV